ncbi:hypothetical protein ASE70_15055 [Sphingomonas sp. Leaf22]|uniref:phage tail tube protein n=1 Tax=Sphingomonas sp. Leaf22 TaxID=1735687 RepID=UPI0007011B38|nr:phage tail tube protein [Sphingomonas sp. Leaf22]KQM92230.1 hypothetical protein ASE70_15055 [Sphingomonas sp. Leaf22]
MAVTPTKRARGADALLNCAFESGYGQQPASGFFRQPFVSHQLGATQGWIESDLLGQGRAPFDPTEDVVVNDGNLVVPVDTRAIGIWLKLMFGDPATTGTTGAYVHEYLSGAPELPSMSIEVGLPTVPSYSTNYGMRGNTMQIGMQRSGLLNATLALIGKGETPVANASRAGTPDTYDSIQRFAQARGAIKQGSDVVGGVASAQFTYSNALDKVETIQPDGEIEDVDPGMPAFTGSLVLRDLASPLVAAGVDKQARAIEFGWQIDSETSLIFRAPRVFFPRVKRPIEGPAGIQQSVDFAASSVDGIVVTAILKNDVSGY